MDYAFPYIPNSSYPNISYSSYFEHRLGKDRDGLKTWTFSLGFKPISLSSSFSILGKYQEFSPFAETNESALSKCDYD